MTIPLTFRMCTLLGCAIVVAGCRGEVEAPTEKATPIVEMNTFDIEWPTLEMVEPSPAIIGQDVKIVGHGGWLAAP